MILLVLVAYTFACTQEPSFVFSCFAYIVLLCHLQGQQAAAQGNALPFVVLNGAFARDVACVSVPAGLKVQQPLHILYLSTGQLQIAQHADVPVSPDWWSSVHPGHCIVGLLCK